MKTKVAGTMGLHGSRQLVWLLFFLGWGSVAVLQAQTTNIYWVGGTSTNWSDAANWKVAGSGESRVPGTNDIAHLGYSEYVVNGTTNAITDTAQAIYLDLPAEELVVRSMNLEPTGNRTVHLTGNPLSFTQYGALTMTANATANATVGVTVYRRWRVWNLETELFEWAGDNGAFYNHSPTAELTMSLSILRDRRGTGTVRLTGELQGWGGPNAASNFYDGGTNIIATASFVDARSSRRFAVQHPDAVFLLTQDSELTAQYRVGTTVRWGVIESDEDVALNMRSTWYASSLGTQTIIPTDGSLGNLILEVRYFPDTSPGYQFVTIPGSIVSLNPNYAEDRSMIYADNPGISGGGSLLHNARTTGRVFTIGRAMTYTGRTMLQQGVLRLGTHIEDEGEPEEQRFYGQLPEATIVELGVNATLDLAGVNQTIGGLTGFRGRLLDQAETFGKVTLGGGRLTINAAAQDTSFAGTIEGEGALVKRGAETFTFAAGYTNAAGRTLRIEGGLLEITGALDVEQGAFEIAGGRIEAGTLAAGGMTWDVTLAAGQEDEGYYLVSADSAVITDGSLVLRLAEGFEPELETQFTLLRVAGTITGDVDGRWLGIEDGGEIAGTDGTLFRLDFAGGSEQLVLTVIPEPGSLALLALALLGAAARRIRRGR